MYNALDTSLNADPYRMTGREIRVGGQMFSTLEFAAVTDARTNENRPQGISKLSYYVKQKKDGGFDLCRSDRHPGTDEQSDTCNDPILINNIFRFEVEFIDKEKNMSNHWDSDAEEFGHRMPVSLSITLWLLPEKAGKVFKTAVTLPVNREVIE